MLLHTNMAWPPRPDEVTTSLRLWDAWYTGDRRKLDAAYSSLPRVRPSQYAGGLVGAGSRLLWGAPPALGQRDHRLHLPMAADIASVSGDLLFGEELQIDWNGTAEKGNLPTAQRDRIAHILDGNMWQSLLVEAGELTAALGGVYLRAGWDDSVADHVLVSVVGADGAIPNFSYGHLQEVTFWDVIQDDGSVVIRHTETHIPGEIVHQVWQGTKTTLGSLRSLADFPETAALAKQLDTADSISTGVPFLTVAYIPNIRPVPQFRSLADTNARYLGRSDYGVGGVMGFFDALDETWTSWIRDIRHGRSRLMVSNSALITGGPGEGSFFDLDQEIYDTFRVPPGEDPSIDKMIQPQQFRIRVEEHARTVKELTLAIVGACGYSGGTFGLDSETAKTATEVDAVRQGTRATREKKTRYWTPQLERFLQCVTALDTVVFHSNLGGLEPKVSFPAYSSPTQLELAQTAQALKVAGAASTDTLIRLVHPDWDDTQVAAELKMMQDEDEAAANLFAGGSNPLMPDGQDDNPGEDAAKDN